MKRIFLNKRTYFLTIIAVFLLGNVVSFAASPLLKEIKAYLDSSIQMTIHGKEFIAKDANGNRMIPISYNGNTYLPTRAISEAVGLNVQWDEKTRTVKLGNYITDQSGEKKIVLKSPDDSYQLTFNEGWAKDNSLKAGNPSIDLGVSSTSNAYTMVFAESTEDFNGDLIEYSEIITSQMQDNMDKTSVENLIELEIDGHPARQVKLHGLVSGFNLTYFITIIKTEDNFYQVISWTTQSNFDKVNEEFVEIANSFKVKR